MNKMNKLMKNVALLLALLAVTTAEAAVPSRLSYRGMLKFSKNAIPGGCTLPLTFRVYDVRPDAATNVVWARTFSVVLETNGTFYTELNDFEGINRLPGAPSLADAIAGCDGEVEIGHQPEGMQERRPRQRFGTYVRATRAARAGAADFAYTPGTLTAPGVIAEEVHAGGVTVPEGGHAVLPSGCRFSPQRERVVGGSSGTALALKGVNLMRPTLPLDRGCYVNDGDNELDFAASDMLLTYENEQGAYNVILPAGGRVTWGGGGAAPVATNVQTVAVGAFGEIKKN